MRGRTSSTVQSKVLDSGLHLGGSVPLGMSPWEAGVCGLVQFSTVASKLITVRTGLEPR